MSGQAAMSPSSIREQLQKRLQALEQTKTMYSERAKMFLGERATTPSTTVVRAVSVNRSDCSDFDSTLRFALGV